MNAIGLLVLLSQPGSVGELMMPAKPLLVGEYSYSTGFTRQRLELKKDGTFISRYGDCTSKATWQGTWNLDGDVVIVTANKWANRKPVRYVPIRWDAAMFLVRETRVQAFARWIKSDRRARMSSETDHLRKFGSSPASGKERYVPKRYLGLFAGT